MGGAWEGDITNPIGPFDRGGVPVPAAPSAAAAMAEPSAFSSSRRLRQATFGFKFLSRTCCSRVMMTSTAMFKIPNFVCGLSDLRCDMQILPNSFKASLMSRIRILSRALLAAAADAAATIS